MWEEDFVGGAASEVTGVDCSEVVEDDVGDESFCVDELVCVELVVSKAEVCWVASVVYAGDWELDGGAASA